MIGKLQGTTNFVEKVRNMGTDGIVSYFQNNDTMTGRRNSNDWQYKSLQLSHSPLRMKYPNGLQSSRLDKPKPSIFAGRSPSGGLMKVYHHSRNKRSPSLAKSQESWNRIKYKSPKLSALMETNNVG